MHVYVSLMDINWERLEWTLHKSMSLKPLVSNCRIKCLLCFTLSFTLINGKCGHDSIQSTSFYRVLRTRRPDGLHQEKKKKKHLHNAIARRTIVPPRMAFKQPSSLCLQWTEKPQRERKSEGRKSRKRAKKEAQRKWERDPFCVSVKHWFHHWTKTHNFKSEIKY